MRVILTLLAASLLPAARPGRIVSTAPSVTEILFALGAGDRVVGVSSFCHYPPEAARRSKVGSYLHPNLEVIASLKPDLAVIIRNSNQLKSQLGNLGLPVVEVDPRGTYGIFRSIEQVGAAIGDPGSARKLNAHIRARLDQVRARASKVRPRTVAFIVGRTPGALEGLVAVGKDSWLGEVLSIAGGRNVFADAPTTYPRVPLEEMLGRNPEVIIDMGDMAQTAGVTEEHKRSVVELWKRQPALSAVRNGRVYAVASDIFVVPGPRVVEAAEQFFQLIHGKEGK